EFLAWDDFRVLNELRDAPSESARALRERGRIYALAAEFNAERDLDTFERCEAALRERYGQRIWSDEQEQLLHRLPMSADGAQRTIWIGTSSGNVVDARKASDLIAKMSGKAYWRKLFVERAHVDVEVARSICREIVHQSQK
ncbi:MAG: hypothetical protein M3M96_05160, partial [Candidatus Eremiobacteraeota bacterium]|nr:hypothetical protein [Candidatus Eremiobacteraeota bacterium]